jgi:hypothetical protein
MEATSHEVEAPLTREYQEPVIRAAPRVLAARGLRGLELTMAQLGVSDVIVGEVQGPLTLAVLERAAHRMQRRHPGLRARIVLTKGGDVRPRVEFCEPDRSRLHVEEVRSAELLEPSDARLFERVAEREVNYRFDLQRGYMFRVVWVPGLDDTGHLIVNVQHALVDGISLMRLLHDLLRECGEILSGRESGELACDALPPTPAVLDQMPVSVLERLGTALVRRSLIRAQRDYHRDSPFPIHNTLPLGWQVRTHARFHSGTPDNYRKVIEACRRQNVTVGGAFAAATEFASLRLIYEETGYLPSGRRRVHMPMTMDFSMRPAIEGASRSQPNIGLYMGSCDVSVRVPETVSFWQLARTLKGRMTAQFARRSPLLFHQVLDHLWDLGGKLDEYGIDYVKSGGVGEAINISNVGPYPYASSTGPLTLSQVYGINSSMKGGPMFIVWLRALDGHFCYSATNAYPAADRTRGDRLFAYLVELMEQAHLPTQDDLTLRGYLRE